MKPIDDQSFPQIPPFESILSINDEVWRREAEQQAKIDQEARTLQLAQEWHDAGMRAYQAGKKRTDYPFKAALRRSGLDIAWKTGWDTGALLEAMQAGFNSQRNDPCPYKDPFLAAHWRQGWHGTHGLQAVGAKKPASREQDAKPACFKP